MQLYRTMISPQAITVSTSMWKRAPIQSFFHPSKYKHTKPLSEFNSNLRFLLSFWSYFLARRDHFCNGMMDL